MKPTVFIKRFALAAAIASLSTFVVAQVGTTSSNPSNDMVGQSSQQSDTGSQPVSTRLSPIDQAFVRDAAQGGKAEVELGHLAEQKAENPQVKQFAERMVRDHGKANEQLDQLAANEGIQLPSKLDAKDQMTMDELSKLSGSEFDKAYMSDMLKDHKMDISQFKHEDRSGSNPQVKQFASQTLPVLESHLREAEKVAPATRTAANQGMKGAE